MPNTKKVIQKVVQTEHDVEDVISDVVHETSLSFKPKSPAGRRFRIFLKRGLTRWINRNIRYIFVSFLVFFISIYSFIKINALYDEINILKSEGVKYVLLDETVIEQKKEIEELTEKLNNGSYIYVNEKTLLKDMKQRFPNISNRVAEIIVKTVLEESKKYNINPMILYALGGVESSHRHWIEHDKVTVQIENPDGSYKNIITRAVGWGGVVWEIHKKMLIEKGIATTKGDLFYPEINIRASAAIYDMYFKMEKRDGVTSQDVSAQRRYFGGNFKVYSDRISAEIMQVIKSTIYR